MLVLIVEPEGPFRSWLGRTLREAGFGHIAADDVFQAQELAASSMPEVVALGPSLPLDEAVVASGRFSRHAAVAAFRNALGDAAKARLRNAGAAEALARPLAPAPTAERLRRIALDRFAGSGANRIACAEGAVIDLARREVRVRGVAAPLRTLEYRVMEMLALRGGETLSRDAILDRLYAGREEPGQKIVDVTICTLRRKLRALLPAPLVQTRRGGYALSATAVSGAAAA